MIKLTTLSALLCISVQLGSAQTFTYPSTQKNWSGRWLLRHKVADPYRWLENDKSAETAEWVKAENTVTFDYLSKIPFRC